MNGGGNNVEQLIHNLSARGPETRLGTWIALGHPVIAELAADCGLDWLLLDLEHGVGDAAQVLPCLQAVRGSGCAGIVRVPSMLSELGPRVLDWGAAGIMFPRVNTADEAAACVASVLYPPHGHRGFSRSSRAHGYGLRPADPASTPPPLIMIQIETLEAVRNAAEIARVPAVDVLFIGPADLGLDLASRPPAGYDLDRCLRETAEAARAAGISCGTLVRDRRDWPRLRELGYTHLAFDSDLAMLKRGFQSVLELRDA